MELVRVSDAIRDLREQLEIAQAEGSSRTVRFAPESVEIEMGIILKDEETVSGKVKAWFLDLGGGVRSEDEARHVLKILLKPVDAHGRPTLIASPELETDGGQAGRADRVGRNNPDFEQ